MAPPRVHELDLEQVGVDITPPGEIPAVDVEVIRGQGPRPGDGCSMGGAGSLDDLGRVILHVATPTDDGTSADLMGYRVVHFDGKLPSNIAMPTTEAWRLERLTEDGGGDLYLYWDDGSTDHQESLDFTIDIVPIDLAGNEGPAYRVRIRDGGDAGCARSGQSSGPWMLLTLLIVFVAVVRVAGRRGPGASYSARS